MPQKWGQKTVHNKEKVCICIILLIFIYSKSKIFSMLLKNVQMHNYRGIFDKNREVIKGGTLWTNLWQLLRKRKM